MNFFSCVKTHRFAHDHSLNISTFTRILSFSSLRNIQVKPFESSFFKVLSKINAWQTVKVLAFQFAPVNCHFTVVQSNNGL